MFGLGGFSSTKITGSADDDARVIFGANIDESLTDEVRITVVATGFDNRKQRNAPTLAGDMEVSPKGSWKAPEREDRMYSAPKKESPFEQHRVSSGNGPSTAPRPVEQKSVSFNQEPVRDDSSDDEDLGIPAFIRRKMM